VPDDLDVISYIKTNPMYDAIQTGMRFGAISVAFVA